MNHWIKTAGGWLWPPHKETRLNKNFDYSKLTTVMEWYSVDLFESDEAAMGAFELAHQQGLDGAGTSIQKWMGLTDEEDKIWRSGKLPPKRPQRKTYFIEDTLTGFIKIGMSFNPDKRIALLQTGCPGKLELICTNDIYPEEYFHKKYAEYRERGEWFRCEGRLKTSMEEAKRLRDKRIAWDKRAAELEEVESE